MKKILSLLALLVMTLTAFATDYTGHRTVTFGSMPSTESDDAVLTITDNGDNTFNVTFKDVINVDGNYTDNYGTFIFSNVAGTTENGVTTIDLSNLSASLENCALGLKEASDGVLFAKFNAEKAYAKFSAKIGSYYKSTISAEFGVNDFESTGGGSTGGGDEKPAAFEKVDFVGDGTNFNWSIPVDWDTQKIVMSISTATCTTGCEHIIGLGTDGTSWAGNLHMYRTSSDKQLQCYFGAGAINTGKFDEGNPIKVEISKANGFIVDGTTRITAEQLADLFTMSTVVMGTGEGSNILSHATYNYVKVVDKDWTETTEPETPKAVVYNNDLTIVRDADHKVYENAEVTVLAKGEGKYEVTLPEFADMDLTNAGTVGKIVFEANGEEVDGVLQLTAENAAGVISTGENWASYAADVTMSGEVENGQLAATFTVVLGAMSDYTYELGFGKEIFIPTTETVTDWANIKFGDSDPVNIENAKLDITMVSATTAKLTFKDVVINGNTIGDFAISDVKASLNPEDYTTVLTTEATNGTWVRTVEDNALGVFVGDESDIRNFEGTQDEEASKTVVKFGVFFGSAYGWADIVFGEKAETPEPPVEDYAINFDKDAKQTHSSRYSTSVSLQQTGKDKQTIEFGKTMNGYEDLTAEKFTVEAGSEVTPSIGYVGEWMHGYVYIDLDNDKQFSFNAEGEDQTGTDVVSFSYFSGKNSKGESVENSCNVNPMPSFTAPTTPGTYRIRFKVDWDNIDAGGSVLSTNHILNNGGGIYDATLEVVEPVVDGISSINAEVANGEAQLFTVDGVKLSKLQKGLNIVRSADGKVKKVLVK